MAVPFLMSLLFLKTFLISILSGTRQFAISFTFLPCSQLNVLIVANDIVQFKISFIVFFVKRRGQKEET